LQNKCVWKEGEVYKCVWKVTEEETANEDKVGPDRQCPCAVIFLS
jgi:hypothetical protein